MVLSQLFSEQNPVEKRGKNCDSTIFYKKMMLSEFFSEQNPGGKRGKKTVTAPFFYTKMVLSQCFFGSRPVLKLRKQGQNIWALSTPEPC